MNVTKLIFFVKIRRIKKKNVRVHLSRVARLEK